MSLAEKQRQLIEKYRVIEDAHERMSAIVARGKKWPEPTAEERTETNLVPGCVSRVWLLGSCENGRCHFRLAADSPLVKGLAALICELYDGASFEEILDTEPAIIDALGLARMLSPTRLNGLTSVRRSIRAFAENQAAQ